MLEIKNLKVKVEDKTILNGINLTINPGEIHAIMGPNGSGKSTLGNIISGRDGYEVISGEIIYKGKNLLEMEIEERAAEGIFLAFQYPVEIPGVNNLYFLKEAYNAIKKHNEEDELDAIDFMKYAKDRMKLVDLNPDFLNRAVNHGFSGGEKKRNEIFQMAVLNPDLAILDETDSGLDIDALKTVAGGVNALKNPEKSVILITHYQRLLDYIVPDYVHVLSEGKIIKTGDKSLALELEDKGYDWLKESA
jgi:Fe-S cluster assembly ATP-binding protein